MSTSTDTLTYREAKLCIEDLTRSGFEKLLRKFDEDVIKAALACDIQPADIEEAYQGEYDSNEDFVEHLLDDLCELPKLPGYIHIDWERTARDVMMDYCTENGHYFRNL